MAILTIANAAPDYQWWPDLFEADFLGGSPGITRTATAFTVTWTSGQFGAVEIAFTGTGLEYTSGTFPDGGRIIGGTMNGLTVRVNGTVWLTATQLNRPAEDIDHMWLGWERRGQYREGDAFNLFTLLLNGNDQIFGSDRSDDIIAGRNPGNDTIFGGGGRDYIKADAGNDVIDGGADRDTYSLTESFFDEYAFRGAVVNLATGVATDSWGGTDTLISIERVEGSRLSDRFTGSAADEQFMGLKGRDTIDGGGGNDWARYDRDADYGGVRGVNVNLTAGTARDGWGQLDTLTNIENVRGTAQADTITGNAANNWIVGGNGVDAIDGRGGSDTVEFWNDFVTSGAVVNLSLASGQVRNDGFGNIETLVSIENLYGTFRNDSLTGNGGANWLYGDEGADTLIGGGGADTLVGGAGSDRLTGGAGADHFRFNRWDDSDPWGDRITDFTTGVDKLVFDTADFAGMGTTLRFVNGTQAGGSGASWFYFDTVTDRLFWDRDGIGGTAAVLVATLAGVNTLAAADFQLL